MNARLPLLKIEHNHGTITLRDVELIPDEYRGHTIHTARGTVVDGYSVSRLGSATSTRHEKPGKAMDYPLWGRRPRETAPGQWIVDVCSCG